MAGVWKNRGGNAIATPVRMGLGAPAHAAVDLTKTAIGYYKDTYDIALETVNEIQETISEAGKRGKWYHKAANVGVIAPLGSAAKVITGSIQTTFNPIVNGVFNVAKTGWNFLKNEFNSIGSIFSKKPVSDFSFKKLDLTKTWKSRWHPKNLLLGGAVAGTAAAVEKSIAKSDSQSQKSGDTKTKKTLSDMTAKMQAQEKTNKELEKSVLSVKEQMEKQTKLMEQQLDQKDTIIASLQDTNNKSKPKDDANQESSKKKSFEKEANNLKDHIDTLVPEGYKTRIDTPGGYQRIVISDPNKKEKKHKPEFYLTFLDANTVKLNYSPYDRVNDQREAANYVGYFSFDDDKLKDCVKTISFAMKDGKSPSSIDKHLQEKYSLKKSMNKDTIDEKFVEEEADDYVHNPK